MPTVNHYEYTNEKQLDKSEFTRKNGKERSLAAVVYAWQKCWAIFVPFLKRQSKMLFSGNVVVACFLVKRRGILALGSVG